MPNVPTWDRMTEAQKIEELRKWLGRVDEVLQHVGGQIQSLHQRLDKLDGEKEPSGQNAPEPRA
jgi:hypothetical protein